MLYSTFYSFVVCTAVSKRKVEIAFQKILYMQSSVIKILTKVQ